MNKSANRTSANQRIEPAGSRRDVAHPTKKERPLLPGGLHRTAGCAAVSINVSKTRSASGNDSDPFPSQPFTEWGLAHFSAENSLLSEKTRPPKMCLTPWFSAKNTSTL